MEARRCHGRRYLKFVEHVLEVGYSKHAGDYGELTSGEYKLYGVFIIQLFMVH